METILGSSDQDRRYLVLCVLAGFLLVVVHDHLEARTSLGPAASFLVVFGVYAVVFDGPHFFATYARTLLDRDFMKHNGRWYTAAFTVIASLPVATLWILTDDVRPAFSSQLVLGMLLRLAYVFGFYHLVMQNWGFIVLYRKKAGEPDDGTERWERLLLVAGSFFPFLRMARDAPVWFGVDRLAFAPAAEDLPYVVARWHSMADVLLLVGVGLLLLGVLARASAPLGAPARHTGLFLVACAALCRLILRFGAEAVLDPLIAACGVVVLIAAVALIVAVARRRALPRPHPGKWAVLASTLVLYNALLALPIDNKQIVAIGITIPHNIQYVAFCRHFAGRYYGASAGDHGVAATLARKAWLLVGASLLYGLVFEGLRTGAILVTGDDPTEGWARLRDVVGALFVGVVLHHYYLDSVIWKVRKDPVIGAAV
ncbi:MAG: hypothetical protein FJ137_10995 [Deltaproteobacteria bacterium]|nr:hypothetical protein [Deltaproteobacteria bacterium]